MDVRLLQFPGRHPGAGGGLGAGRHGAVNHELPQPLSPALSRRIGRQMAEGLFFEGTSPV